MMLEEPPLEEWMVYLKKRKQNI